MNIDTNLVQYYINNYKRIDDRQ